MTADYEKTVPLFGNLHLLHGLQENGGHQLNAHALMGLTPASQADTLAARLGYAPRDRALFVVALTHRSAEGPNNERLEFLGDSVLNLLLSERLYREFPDGERRRPVAPARAPRERGAAGRDRAGDAARRVAVAGFGRAQDRRLPPPVHSRRCLRGAVRRAVSRRRPRGRAHDASGRCSKRASRRCPSRPRSRMRRRACRNTCRPMAAPLPVYTVKRTSGEPHAQTFLVSCAVPHAALETEGEGPSRRRAEQVAAQAALARAGSSMSDPRSHAIPRGIRRARRPPQRRQVDAAQCARRRKALHRHVASADHAPSRARRAQSPGRAARLRRYAGTASRREARAQPRHEPHRRRGARRCGPRGVRGRGAALLRGRRGRPAAHPRFGPRVDRRHQQGRPDLSRRTSCCRSRRSSRASTAFSTWCRCRRRRA